MFKEQKEKNAFKSRHLYDIYLKSIILEIKVGKINGDYISKRKNYCHRAVHFYYLRHSEDPYIVVERAEFLREMVLALMHFMRVNKIQNLFASDFSS